MNPTKCNSGTSETHCWGSQKSDAGLWGFCLAARRTAAWWQGSFPPLQGAAGPWGRPPAALRGAQAPAALWRTVSPDRLYHKEARWTGTPHPHPISPGWTKHGSAVLEPSKGQGPLNKCKVNFSYHSPWVPSSEQQSRIFWTGPPCRCAPSVSCTRQPESYGEKKGEMSWEQKVQGWTRHNIPTF